MGNHPLFYPTSMQVTGLPGSGKTRSIDLFQITTGKHPERIDLARFQGSDREAKFRQAIKSATQYSIAESACGIWYQSSYIIRLTIPTYQLYANLTQRDKVFDPDYLSLLGQQMIRADITVTSSEDLQDLLGRLF